MIQSENRESFPSIMLVVLWLRAAYFLKYQQ